MLEYVTDVKHPNLVLHHRAELFHNGLLLYSHDLCVCITHHCDKEIHKHKLDNDSRHQEEDPHNGPIVLRIVVLVKVAKASQIGVDYSIEGNNVRVAVKDRSNFLVRGVMTIELEYHDAVCESD